MSRILVTITFLVFALSIAGGLYAEAAGNTAEVAKAAQSQARALAARASGERTHASPQMIGMTLNVYHTPQIERDLTAIDRIHQAGFNTLQIVTPVFQTNGASEIISAPVGPGRCPSPKQLVRLLLHAHELGMRTVFMPQVNFTHPRGNEWRGKIHPHNWGPWWKSYDAMIRQYLSIAIKGKADVFTVGCELVSTLGSQHLPQWRKVIAYCRDHFSGKLTFSITWDSYDRVEFWKDLDYIGISGYWDLTTMATDPDHPTPDELAKRWAQIRDRLLAFAKSKHRPLLITEVGYPALPWGLKDPWNYVNSNHIAAAPKVQAMGYQSFLRAWSAHLTPPSKPAKVHPHMAGVLFYDWNINTPNPLDDTGYSIVGKPAYNLVHGWLEGKGIAKAAELQTTDP